MKYFAPLILVLLASPVLFAEEDGGRWERMRRHDADGDGRVSREEFAGPDRFFDRLDADGDGFVTQAEAKADAGAEGRRAPSRRRGAGAAGLRLEHVDADRDGKVTRDEWLAFFAATDCDSDGTISEAEWRQVLQPQSRPDGGRAPAVGAKAPAVKAARLDDETKIVDLGAPKRTTVLIFGSWT